MSDVAQILYGIYLLAGVGTVIGSEAHEARDGWFAHIFWFVIELTLWPVFITMAIASMQTRRLK